MVRADAFLKRLCTLALPDGKKNSHSCGPREIRRLPAEWSDTALSRPCGLFCQNGVVIHVAGDLDWKRLGDEVIAADQIPGKATAVTSFGRTCCETKPTNAPGVRKLALSVPPKSSPKSASVLQYLSTGKTLSPF